MKAKVLWAIDTLSSGSSLEGKTAKTLKALTTRWKTPLLPVTVVLPNYHSFFSMKSTQYEHQAAMRLTKKLRNIKFLSLNSPKIIVQKELSLRKAAQALVAFATQKHAELIVVCSHQKKGVSRLFLGSFAETLLLLSKVPLLVIHPKNPPIRKFKRLGFPTDFSAQDAKTFRKVISLAQRLKMSISLIHQVDYQALSPVIGIEMDLNRKEFEKRWFAQKQKQLDQFRKLAEKRGVKVDTYLLQEGKDSIPDAICRFAKRKHLDLLLVTAHRGQLASFLLGSFARAVVRAAPCPVWVLH